MKAKPVDRTDSANLIPFIEGAVAPGAKVYTDDAKAYKALPGNTNQYNHDTVAHGSGEYVRATLTPTGLNRFGPSSSGQFTALGTMPRPSTLAGT